MYIDSVLGLDNYKTLNILGQKNNDFWSPPDYTGWTKSHFTLFKVNKTKRNKAKKNGYISNERQKLEVSLGI